MFKNNKRRTVAKVVKDDMFKNNIRNNNIKNNKRRYVEK